ncbi:MAG: BON domain-containing protein [Planctomycetes bacterium]|nr:BON domain-containing protein [Planctomycetota bacterium]
MSLFAKFLPVKGAVYEGAAILLGLLPTPYPSLLPSVHAADQRVAQQPDLSGRDWLLTNQARRALQKDEQLAALRIGVSVKDKVATIWGTIPSADTAKRAEELLRKISGIVIVMNDCQIVASDPIPQAVADAVKKARELGEDPNTSAKLDPASPTTPASRVVAKPGPDLLDPTVSVSNSVKPPPAATLQVPVAIEPDQNLDTWERIRRSDNRFKDMNLVMKDGVLKISGSAARLKDAWDLAGKLNALPNVKQVIVGAVTEK